MFIRVGSGEGKGEAFFRIWQHFLQKLGKVVQIDELSDSRFRSLYVVFYLLFVLQEELLYHYGICGITTQCIAAPYPTFNAHNNAFKTPL